MKLILDIKKNYINSTSSTQHKHSGHPGSYRSHNNLILVSPDNDEMMTSSEICKIFCAVKEGRKSNNITIPDFECFICNDGLLLDYSNNAACTTCDFTFHGDGSYATLNEKTKVAFRNHRLTECNLRLTGIINDDHVKLIFNCGYNVAIGYINK